MEDLSQPNKKKKIKRIPDGVMTESNLNLIEENHKAFQKSGAKRAPDFLIQGTDETLYTADFINLNKLRLTEIDTKRNNVYYLVRAQPEQVYDHFTLR